MQSTPASLFIRGGKPRRAKSTATPSNPITDGAANFAVGFPPTLPPLPYTLFTSGTRQPAIIFSRRVPAAVAAVPQSAYRTFMRPSERTRVRLHAICDRDGTRRRVGRALRPPVRRGTRAYKYVIDERADSRIDRGISNSIYILNAEVTKKIIRSGTRRSRMRPNLTERRNRQE